MSANTYRFLMFLLFLTGTFRTGSAQRLVVSDNGRYLTYEDGRPFFYLGDTAWELFHRLDQEAACRLELLEQA